MLDLFGTTLLSGLSAAPARVTPDEEAALIAEIDRCAPTPLCVQG